MNTTYFIKKLRYLIEAQQPFIAYWHNHGYCILRTGEVNMYVPDGRGGQAEPAPTCCRGGHTNPGTIDSSSRILRSRKTQGVRTTRASAASVKKLRRLIEKMRADWKTRGSLTVVEYDGMNLDVVGNPEIVEVLV